MSKGEGKKITIKFTEDLVGDVSGTEGQVPKKLNIISATSSSQFSNDFKPDFAIDGNVATRWASLNKAGTQYIQFDLGIPRKIERIKAMCGSGYIPETFNILVSSDGNNFTTISTGKTISVADTLVEFAFVAIDCRYIRLVMTSTSSGNFYELKEFEAYSAGAVGNEVAFTIRGKEYKYVRGPLLDREYKPISVERHPTVDKAILLTFPVRGEFNNAEGALTVEYDATKGNLSGQGGAVESFTEVFTPTGLKQTPNPGIEETITVSPTQIIADFLKVEYIEGYGIEAEKITAAPVSVTVELLHTSVVNP